MYGPNSHTTINVYSPPSQKHDWAVFIKSHADSQKETIADALAFAATDFSKHCILCFQTSYKKHEE